MTEDTADESAYALRMMFPSPLSPINMPQSDEQTTDLPRPTSSQNGHSLGTSYSADVVRKFHQHTISDSTTDSNDSSPTTTVSLVDDSSATEPSPGSSPESPAPNSFVVGMLRPRTSGESRPFFELQKQPPPRKGRNLKNLAVNTARQPARPATANNVLQGTANGMGNGSITSSAFVRPPPPSRRKTGNQLGLTLLTPGSSTFAPQDMTIAIPPTPSLTRPAMLRHFQSSPSLPLVSIGSPHEYRSLNSHPYQIQPTLETILSPAESHIDQAESGAEEEEQNFEVPLSREAKPEAYPDGPICVYEPFVDLYLEPTVEQARQYDVIMNVAGEVRNPFLTAIDNPTDSPEIRIDGGGGIQYAPKRDRIAAPPTGEEVVDDGSPSTPRATPLGQTFANTAPDPSIGDPEYIHIPWEHNSDIVPDLLRLCQLVDDKINEGKRVLIHCQCGVSRSASLVVAYGLWKNPAMSVQEAYDAVKKKSKWIGPNMNLIMQLQEFRSSLVRRAFSGAHGITPITPSSALSELSYPFGTAYVQDSSVNTPLSSTGVRLPQAQRSLPSPSSTSGPSSAPLGSPWPAEGVHLSGRARALSAVKPGSAYVDATGKIVPMIPTVNITEPVHQAIRAPPPLAVQQDGEFEEADAATPTASPLSFRSDEFAMTALRPSPEIQSVDAFGLMSPSSTEFATNPFDRSVLLAQLGMDSVNNHEDDGPRRSKSLRSTATFPDRHGLQPASIPRLRGKISSPTLREQQQLQSLQAKIEASLPQHNKSPFATHSLPSLSPSSIGIDEALMSPRATEFTDNPFALSLPPMSSTSSTSPDSASSRLTVADNNNDTESISRTGFYDPRSPAHKGVSPITRNILDVL